MALEALLDEETIQRMRGKPFGINPNSRYNQKEFIAKAGELFGLDKGYRDLTENSGDHSALRLIGSIALGYMPGDKEENAQVLRDSYNAIEQAEALLNVGNKKMAKFVENNFREIVPNLSLEVTASFAVQYGLPKDLGKLRNARTSGNPEEVKRAYFEKIGSNPELMKGAASLDNSTIKYLMDLEYEIKERRFIIDNLTSPKSGFKREFDPTKAQQYISRVISQLDDKKKAGAYLTLGLGLYQQVAK